MTYTEEQYQKDNESLRKSGPIIDSIWLKTMTPEQQAILDILEDSKGLAYERYNKTENEYWYSAVLVLSPTAIDRIKLLFAKQK